MAQVFKFEAKNSRGEIVRGKLEADTEGQAYQQLSTQGFFPMSLEILRPQSASKENRSFAGKLHSMRGHRVSVRELAGVFEHMSILLSSGFPVLKCLQMVEHELRNPLLANAVSQVIKDIQLGTKLSEAMSNFPTVFPPTVNGAVQAGEASGKLDEIFSELARAFEAEAELRGKIKAALIYPAFVSLFGLVTVFFVMTFIVPKLLIFFETWDHPLPLPTRILLGISSLFQKGLGVALAALIGIGIFAWRRLNREKRIALISNLTKAIPFIQSVLFLSDFVPLARTWSLLLKSGVPILESMRITESVVADLRLRRSLKRVSDQVVKGSSLTQSLREEKIFPALALSFLAVGEESGGLDTALQRIAQFYERELDQKLKFMTTLLEPILILLVGLGICFIVLSLLLPIFEINMLAQ